MSDPEPVFKCSVCDKELKSAYSLKRHENVHAQRVPCPYCLKPIKAQHRVDAMKKHLSTCKALRRLNNLKPTQQDNQDHDNDEDNNTNHTSIHTSPDISFEELFQ